MMSQERFELVRDAIFLKEAARRLYRNLDKSDEEYRSAVLYIVFNLVGWHPELRDVLKRIKFYTRMGRVSTRRGVRRICRDFAKAAGVNPCP